jgi:hypothetical protein
MNANYSNLVLGDQIPIEKWEDYWIESSLRPFEVKMLSRKRCNKAILEKAEQDKSIAKALLEKLEILDPEDEIFKFTVSPRVEGMAWYQMSSTLSCRDRVMAGR